MVRICEPQTSNNEVKERLTAIEKNEPPDENLSLGRWHLTWLAKQLSAIAAVPGRLSAADKPFSQVHPLGLSDWT